MNIKTESKEDTLIVRMSGELDLLTVTNFKDKVLDKTEKEGINNLILNLAKVTFIDSSGLGAILGRYRYLNKKGGRVILVSLKPQVERIFRMAGMLKIMDHYSSEQEAVKGLNEGRTA
ncbi:MAG: anti-sigma F factor antagonist [Halanaerobiales bacterium]